MDLEFNSFIRKPFTVDAVQVTEDNMAEVAKLVGELKEKDDGTPFIQVDKKKVPNIYRVFPGFWMTRMGNHIRCYSPKIFHDQFVQDNPQIREWVDFVNGHNQTTQEETPVG
jgi:hypothetical protein